MFTDMVGYSALAQRDEALALQILDKHHRLLRPLFPQFGGREIKSTGDGFLVEFSSALAAVQCAIELQRALAQQNDAAAPEKRFQIRIGVHLGDVILREADVFGDGVNIAARIEPLAEAGGICLSRPVVDQVANKIDNPLVKLGTPELKNLQTPIEVYRVVLPWQRNQSAAPARQRQRLNQSWRRPAPLFWVLLLVVILGCWFLYRMAPEWRSGSYRIKSFAVLPFDNLSREPEQGFFTEATWALLGSELGKLQSLQKVVSSKSSVMDYKQRGGKKITEIARELGVDGIVEGSMYRDHDQVRITVKLLDGRADRQLWSESYTRRLGDVVTLQGEVAFAIAREIKLALTPQERSELTTARPVSPAAFEYYVRGRQNLQKWDRIGKLNALEDFRKATQLDTNYAAAYAALADAYLTGQPVLHPRLASQEAQKSLAVALASRTPLGEAQLSLAQIKFQVERDWAGADAIFKTGLQAHPHHAHGHHTYSHFLLALGRTNEAFAESLRFLELDPRSPAAHHHLAQYYGATRQYELAIEKNLDALKIDPNYPNAFHSLAGCYLLMGLLAEGETNANKAVALSPDTLSYRARVGQLAAAAGKTAEARKIVAEVRQRAEASYFPAYNVSLIYVALHEHDAAFRYLQQAIADHVWDVIDIPVEPCLDPLRSDPRYGELLAQMKLR